MIIYEMLQQSALAYADKTALVYGNETITYSELKQRVDSLQKGLLKRGIGPTDRVGLILHNSIDFVVFLYALSQNGNIVCLLNAQWSVKELERKILSTRLDKSIAEYYVKKRIGEENNALDESVILKDECIFSNLFCSGETGSFPFSIEEENEAFIQSSSGTTGFSKMAYRTHKNLDLDSRNIVQTINYTKNDVVFSSVPLCHGYGLMMGLIAPIRCGATIWIQRWFDSKAFLENYEEVKPSIFLGIPEIYDCLYSELQGNKFDFKYNKWFLCSGASISSETGRNFYQVSKIWVSQIYGMMEVSTICANLNSNEDNYLSVGQPIKQIQLKLKPMKQDDLYEILISSDTVSKTYIVQGNDCVIPTEVGWFCTKDIGYFKEDNLFLIDRKKED